jgi:hypothetical protein
MEDVISPKSSNMHLLQALDYFRQAELANGRLAEFKASEQERKAKAKGRSKSLEPMSALDKFRKATEKVVVVNSLRHPMMSAMGYGKADLGKVNDLKERLLKKKGTSF